MTYLSGDLGFHFRWLGLLSLFSCACFAFGLWLTLFCHCLIFDFGLCRDSWLQLRLFGLRRLWILPRSRYRWLLGSWDLRLGLEEGCEGVLDLRRGCLAWAFPAFGFSHAWFQVSVKGAFPGNLTSWFGRLARLRWWLLGGGAAALGSHFLVKILTEALCLSCLGFLGLCWALGFLGGTLGNFHGLTYMARSFGALFIASLCVLTHSGSASIENKLDYIMDSLNLTLIKRF